MTFSDRTHIHLPVITPTEEREHARLQRIVARKVKRCRRWWKAVDRARKFSEHITNRVADARLKETTKRAKNQGLIAVEDLSVQDMMGSASGTLAAPGKQVAQKRGLNRSLGRQGFGITFSQLEYKQGWQGHLFIKVPPAGTSQTCSKCKHKAPENRLSQEKFKCVKCGYEANADDNAADNIKDLGLEQARVRHLLSADGLSVVARGRLSELMETRTKTKTPKRWRKSRKRGIGACASACAPTGNEVV
jgi:putative transposase